MSDMEPDELSDKELFEAYQHAKSQGTQFNLDEIQLEICERWEREVDSDNERRMSDDVYVVFEDAMAELSTNCSQASHPSSARFEDAMGELTTIRGAFDNETAAEAYMDDPDQLGNLFVVRLTLEATHE